MSGELKALFVGPHSLLMTAIAAYLQERRRSYLVTVAGTVEQATRVAADLQVDLVIMDLDVAETACLETCRTLPAGRPNVHIILISAALDDHCVEQALAAGARALLLEADVHSELPAAIDDVLAGGSSFFGGNLLPDLDRFNRRRTCSLCESCFGRLMRRGLIRWITTVAPSWTPYMPMGIAYSSTADILTKRLSRRRIEGRLRGERYVNC